MDDPLLLVVGSVNYDLIFRHERLPSPGETVTGATLMESCGGKGANQAVVAARCARHRDRFPIRVAFAGAVGADAFGEAQRTVFASDGLDASFLFVLDDIHTGTSAVWVDARSGDNRILNSPGANLRLTPDLVADLPIAGAALVLLQNEIPVETLQAVVDRARAASVDVVWNPAPFAPGGTAPLEPQSLRFITPNEVEASALLGAPVDPTSPAEAVRGLQGLGYPGVILTLGRRGVAVGDDDGFFSIPAPQVEAVDTTGAGDAFNGAFAAALVAGMDTAAAARFAVAYASASVRYPGTQTGFPRELPSEFQ